jgi:hypothetical protein
MTRSTTNYPAASSEALKALVAYNNQAVLHVKDPLAPKPDLALLLVSLPQGPISAARVISDGPVNSPTIAFTIKDRNERTIDPEGCLMLRVLILFGMGLFIDKNQKGGEERHYVELGHEGGITLLRLLADAYPREVVRQQADHHDLRASALAIVGGKPTVVRGRREALAEALKSYDTNAVKWGLSDLLSRPDYQALVRGSFRLFDLAHSHTFLRALL